MLKKVIFAIALLAFPLAAQQAPDTKAKPETVESLKVEIARRDLQIAQLQGQLHELQLQVQLYEGVSGVAERRKQDQKAFQNARDALQKASGTVK